MPATKSFPTHNCVQFLYHRHYKEATGQCGWFMRDKLGRLDKMYSKDLKAHWGCVNAIEFSNNGGQWITSGGDDRRVMLWNTEKALEGIGSPSTMKGEHNSNIFCLSFDNSNKKIFSGGNDEQVVLHDVTSGETENVYMHEEAVYSLAVHPHNDAVFASACDDGRILIYDIREPASSDPFCLANYTSPMHAVVYNPMAPQLLATANSKEGIGLWDIRKPRSCLMRYGGSMCAQSCMSVRISRDGERLIALRRRLPPVLYNLKSALPLFQFDHSGYYNSCTMKSCCFAGDKDQYLLSGSDDFNLYMWKIPECATQLEVPWVGEAQIVLRGHRSIVNQVRFNEENCLVISSGVEKVIKAWSAFPMPEASDNYDERPVYSHEEYFNLVLRSGQMMSHDYSHESVEEDPRMIAFFDSLVQRELEGMSSEDSLHSDDALMEHLVQRSASDTSSPAHSDDDDNDSAHNLTLSHIVSDNNTAQQTLEFHHLLDMDSQVRVPSEAPTSVRAMTAENSESASRNPSQASTSNSGSQDTLLNDRSRSISALIANKRKDYLSTVNRLTKLEARKAKRKKEKLKKCYEVVKQRREQRRLKRSVLESDSSDSASSDDTFSSTASSSSASNSDNNNSSANLDELLNRNSSDTHKRMAGLKRLARLRQRVTLSDSDDNGNHAGPSEGHGNLERNGNILNLKNCVDASDKSLSKTQNGNIGEETSSTCVNGSNHKVDKRNSNHGESDLNETKDSSNNVTNNQAQAGANVSNDTGKVPLKYNKRFKNHAKRSKKNYRNRRDDSSEEDSG